MKRFKTYNVIPSRHPHPAVHRDGDPRRVRQDKLYVGETVASPPVLDGKLPSVARVAEAVQEDDGCCVLGRRREDKGRSVDERHF